MHLRTRQPYFVRRRMPSGLMDEEQLKCATNDAVTDINTVRAVKSFDPFAIRRPQSGRLIASDQ